jgi:hypothetical protein
VRAADVLVALKRRHHDNPGFGELLPDGHQRINPAQIRHPEIHQRNVRPTLPISLHCLASSGCLGDKHHVWLAGKDRRDTFAKKSVVIDAKHSNPFLIHGVLAPLFGKHLDRVAYFKQSYLRSEGVEPPC